MKGRYNNHTRSNHTQIQYEVANLKQTQPKVSNLKLLQEKDSKSQASASQSF